MKGYIYMKPGDRLPSRTFQLLNADGSGLNLSTATQVLARLRRGDGSIINRTPAIVNAATGVVRYDFVGDELTEGGLTLLDFSAEFGPAGWVSCPENDWWGIASTSLDMRTT